MTDQQSDGCLAGAAALRSCGCLLTVFVTIPILVMFGCTACAGGCG